MDGNGVGLFEPVLTGGIRSTNFFNGRLLTGEDLRAEQDAQRDHWRQLARAAGAGIVRGFEVTLGPASTQGEATVGVSDGLAFTRDGDPVALASPTAVRLVTAPNASAGPEGDVFKICAPLQTGVRFNNLGLYILTARAASGYEGRAPATEVGQALGVGTGCGSRWTVEGVKFGMVPLDLAAGANPSPLETAIATQIAALEARLAVVARAFKPGDALPTDVQQMTSRLRNMTAYLCFGVERLGGFAIDPFPRAGHAPLATYGLLDALYGARTLTSCDVPLAIIYWTTLGVGFVDMWAVRRPLVASATSSEWPHLAGRRRELEGMAMVLQFQGHITDLARVSLVSLDLARARDYFLYLPPVGALPLPTGATSRAPERVLFFSGMTVRNVAHVAGARLGPLFDRALRFPPIDVRARELVWCYVVRENRQAVTAPSLAGGVRPFLIFTNGHVPYQATARYDLAYWSFGNFSLRGGDAE